MKLDEGEFARAIIGHKEKEPAFRGLHLGNVDVKGADGIAFELLLGSVEIHLELMTAEHREIMAAKLRSVLSARMAMRLNSLRLQKKFSIRCRHL